MHPINLIAKAIENNPEKPVLPCETEKGICALTGEETLCIPRKEMLGKSFTNGDLLARPDSDLIGVDAFFALRFKWESFSSWFCDGESFERLDRIGVRGKVFKTDMPDHWIGYATTSYKKHGSLNAKINTGSKRVWLFEMRLVDLSDSAKVNEWWSALNAALRSGIGRSVLESLDCQPFLINKIGLKTWLEFERWARPNYNSALYSFLCYLLPSQEELKNESNGMVAPCENVGLFDSSCFG